MSKAFEKFVNGYHRENVLTLTRLTKFNRDEQARIKRTIQTDVWFGAQYIFRSPSQPPFQGLHKEICDALVQPNPDVPVSEWSPIKERCILAFRGAGKSTIDAGHICQIILCCPNVRILLLGGSLPRAAATVDLVRRHFNSNDVIRYLFPEFCDVSVSGASFTSPARTDTSLRDETVSIASFRSVRAGWHGEFVKLDDATNEQNQRTLVSVAKTIGSYDDLAPLLEPDTYIDFNGTRWAENDIPQSIKENAEANGTEIIWLEIPVFQVKTGQPNQVDIDRRNRNHDLDLSRDVVFAWEEKWNAQTLAAKYRKPNFDSQYLLQIPKSIVSTPSVIVPDETFLESCRKRVMSSAYGEELRLNETFVMNGDLSEVGQDGSDDCCVVAGIWNVQTHHLTLITIILEKFTDEKVFIHKVYELYDSFTVRLIGCRYGVKFRIENVHQAKHLWKGKLGFPIDFQFPSVERDARAKRICKFFEALREGKVSISEKCNHWEDIIEQFCKYNPQQKERKVDLLDSAAQLWEYVQSISELKPMAFDNRGDAPWQACELNSEGLTPAEAERHKADREFLTKAEAEYDARKNEHSNADIDFQPEPLAPAKENVDPHADENLQADIDFLQSLTVHYNDTPRSIQATQPPPSTQPPTTEEMMERIERSRLADIQDEESAARAARDMLNPYRYGS